MSDLTLQPVRLGALPDVDGRLVFTNGALVAVLSRLSELHGDYVGNWFLEAGFGPLLTPTPPIFPALSDAQNWISERLNRS